MGLFNRTLSRLEELKKTLTRDPASRQFLALADEYRRQGQTREAISVLERGLAQNPSAVAGHVALGRLLQQGGRLDDALAAYQAALRLDPQNLVALRQTADVHVSRGDTVEAVKKLKLFRGLSPGDREVNELIRQLDGELAASAAPRPPTGPEKTLPPPPAPELRTGGIAVSRPRPVAAASPAADVVPVLPPVPRVPVPIEARFEAAPPAPEPYVPRVAPPELDLGETFAGIADAKPAPPGTGDLGSEPADQPRSGLEEPSTPETTASLAPLPETTASLEPIPAMVTAAPATGEEESRQSAVEGTRAGSEPGEPAAHGPGPAAVPVVTETLAVLLRAQGHLGEAHAAYLELARLEPDPARARRFLSLAEEISAYRGSTVRGRLEAWLAPFTRSLDGREGDLPATVREVVERLAPAAAVVTDFEGVPVVDAGPRAEAESMEVLSAELTAFWKNVRRSRAEVGEGALDSLVLTGSAGSVAVMSITPAYALLLKTGPGLPAGRIRFEAVRAAGRLRAALL